MSDDPRNPQLEHVMALAMEGLLDEIRTSQPGRVTAYDAAKQRASVQPTVKRAHINEDEERVVELQPELHGVPVMFLGPPRARITWPVEPGDLCLLVHLDVSVRRLLASGGDVDPGDDRRHDLNDAVAIVGWHNFKSVPTTAPTDAIVFHCGNGVEVRIGGDDASEAAAFHSAIVALRDVFDAWTPVATDGGGALKTLLTTLISSGWPQGATKVKVK